MSGATHGINENDFESPGYEYLRSYQNMSNLYYKLLALNYHKDFCARYKCPPIHRYYFSLPNKNASEQRFLFACLCAWLIKDKCQMNLELEPEEYEDPDIVIGVIFEALGLLVSPEDELSSKRSSKGPSIGFPPGRLKTGFGPEVIWTMNVLTDRALELMLESKPIESSKAKVVYINKSISSSEASRPQSAQANSITIGQPFVGGGLTTRPLGSYQVDDRSLLFDDDDDDDGATDAGDVDEGVSILSEEVDPDEWYSRVARCVPALESAQLIDETRVFEDWHDYIQSIEVSKRNVDEFLNTSRPILEAITNRTDRQLQVLHGREKFIQSNLEKQLDDFLGTWRDYSKATTRHDELLAQVNARTDKFESFNTKLKEINNQIEGRIRELNDGQKLKDLEGLINQLKEEDECFKLKIGLLLTVYSKVQAEIVSANIGQQL